MGKVFQNNGDSNRKMFVLLMLSFIRDLREEVKEGSEAERN